MSKAAPPPGLGAFCRAMWGTWFTAMSGPLSVPAALAALWIENQTAKILLGLTAFACVWAAAYWVWKPEREKVIELQSASSDRDQQKQQLLDDISALREKVGRYRIEMEADSNARRFDQNAWEKKFGQLQDEIASKIEQFSSKAEAMAYSHRGNIHRPANTNMGGLLNQLLVDICIHDLDYLRVFIHDYSRKKDRSI